MTKKLFDILIVGGGMVGASLALRFSQAGLQVAVIEKTPLSLVQDSMPTDAAETTEPPIDLRVSAINRRSEQWLQDIGVWQHLPATRLCPYRALQAFEGDCQPHNEGLTFTATELNQPYLGHIIENNSLQKTMWQQFNEFITLFCPATVVSLSQQSAISGYASVTTKEFGEISGRLLIAADGAQSQLRSLAGIGHNGWQYQQACLVATVDTEYPQQDITWQQFTEQGPRAFLPLPGAQASLVWYDDLPKVKALAQLPAAQLALEIQQNFPAKLGQITVKQQGWFPLTRMHANRYWQGRVVLVGDAAHSINPLAGQGVNLGFADAALLAELVLQALSEGRDLADSQLLQQYWQERKKANLLMMSAMDGFYQLFSSRWPVLRLARKLGLTAAAKAGPLKAWVGAYAAGLKG